MPNHAFFVGLFAFLTLSTFCVKAQDTSASSSPVSSAFPSITPGPSGLNSSTPSTSSTAAPPVLSGPADVVLHVPNLSVGRIELDVDNLQADINLNAAVAGLVSINAGVQVSVQKINITIADVEAQLDLVVRLGNLVSIVGRVFESLDLNPLLLNLINNVTDIVDTVVGAVDGLLGSITDGGKTLSFLVDNLGNIVQQVAGSDGNLVSSIVGNYLQNMTLVGNAQQLSNGLVQKTFSYLPLNALVDIIFNAAGQVVQATVQKKSGSGTGSSTTTGSSSTIGSSSTTVSLPVSTTS